MALEFILRCLYASRQLNVHKGLRLKMLRFYPEHLIRKCMHPRESVKHKSLGEAAELWLQIWSVAQMLVQNTC